MIQPKSNANRWALSTNENYSFVFHSISLFYILIQKLKLNHFSHKKIIHSCMWKIAEGIELLKYRYQFQIVKLPHLRSRHVTWSHPDLTCQYQRRTRSHYWYCNCTKLIKLRYSLYRRVEVRSAQVWGAF